MICTWVTFAIVCPMVFLAGFVDAIAGGGGLISLPAYLFAGVPMHLALGTNKLSSTMGTTISAGRYMKNKYFQLPLAVPSIIAALIGSTIGASLSVVIDEKILQYVLVVVLPVVAYFVLFGKKSEEQKQKDVPFKKALFIVTIASLLIGAYDGFYGPGTGTFLVLVYTKIAGMDIKVASGNTKLVNLSSNVAALVTFLIHGTPLIALGLAAGVFSIAGNYLGSGLVMKNGTKIVRPIILVVLALLFVKVISGLIF